MNQDLSIITLVHASQPGGAARHGRTLMIVSLASWTVIFGKIFGLKRVRSRATRSSNASSGPARSLNEL